MCIEKKTLPDTMLLVLVDFVCSFKWYSAIYLKFQCTLDTIKSEMKKRKKKFMKIVMFYGSWFFCSLQRYFPSCSVCTMYIQLILTFKITDMMRYKRTRSLYLFYTFSHTWSVFANEIKYCYFGFRKENTFGEA